jgi:radical SAM protein with 4Fe4S-binding SPASM domain
MFEGDQPADLEELQRKLRWRGPATDPERVLGVFMDQNNKCNLRCRMCGFSDPRVPALAKYDLPRWLYDRIASEVFPRARYVCLSLMTEPFMTRDFADRLLAVREFGVPFSEVITNATLLTPAAVGKILESRLSRVIISIDGGTREVFESIRTGARFERVLANWHLLQSARAAARSTLPVMRVNHVLSELNIDTFDEFLRLLEQLRPEEVAVRTVSRMSDAEIQETTDAVFWSKVCAAREKLSEFCRRTGIADSGYLRGRPTRIDLFDEGHTAMMCRYPWEMISIHPNGDVYPCMAWSRPPIGSLATETFDEIWNGPALAALRQEFESVRPGVDCLHCAVRKAADDRDDDFFFRKLAKPAPPAAIAPA